MPNKIRKKNAFTNLGFKKTIDAIIKKTQEVYLSDEIPWVVGYSGGKDSTATLQIVWNALAALPPEKRLKKVYVISTDTLVENPIVAQWVEKSLDKMQHVADNKKLPIYPHRLTPKIEDRFWVGIIGRGYPAPRPKFRWCTSRLKISPSNNFINNVVDANGEAILVLGIRKAESTVRAANMQKYEEGSTRKSIYLSRSKDYERVFVYTPISDWSNDDVWMYLTQEKNPWGYSNQSLLNLYGGATEDGECPIVIDTSTPSCGDSRFGCYVCTMVSEDKSMSAMIKNDEEKKWMRPLMELRNQWLDITDKNQNRKYEKLDLDRDRRDFRRMNGSLTIYRDRLVHGPYKQKYRISFLAALLNTEEKVRKLIPKEIEEFQIISIEELEEINRIWVQEKGEIEEWVPAIYEKIKETPYPGKRFNHSPFKLQELLLLKQACSSENNYDYAGYYESLLDEICANNYKYSNDSNEEETAIYEVLRNLISVQYQYRTMIKRSKLYDKLGDILDINAFENEIDAEKYAKKKMSLKNIEEIKMYLNSDEYSDNSIKDRG